MTTTQIIASVVIVLAIVSVATLADMDVRSLWRRFRPWRPAKVESVRISIWRALPGGHLELGATGLQIRYLPGHREADYFLHHPDGRRLASAGAGYLEALKRHGEDVAAELAQFEAVESFPTLHGIKNP